MPLATSVIKRKSDGQGLVVLGRITFSGTYPTGGDTLDLSKLAGITNRQPDIVLITGKAGFIYQYDHTNKKVIVFCNTAGGANAALGEHTNVAYVAGITGDDVRFMATWLTVPNLPDA